MAYEYVDVTALVGKTLRAIRKRDDDQLVFMCEDGEAFKMYHSQSCCESVYLEDVCGDLDDLIGYPILQAEEVSGEDLPAISKYEESFTWTFYKLATVKGSVTLRWYGSSNGYYSESVDFCRYEDAYA